MLLPLLNTELWQQPGKRLLCLILCPNFQMRNWASVRQASHGSLDVVLINQWWFQNLCFFSLTDKNAVVSPPCLLLTAKDTLTQCSLFLARRRQSLRSHERPERWYGFLRTHSCLPIKSKPSLRILYNIINMKKKKLNNNLQPYPFSAINQMF